MGEKGYASPQTLGTHHSCPSANVMLLRRRFTDLAAALPNGLFKHPTVHPVSAPRKNCTHRAFPQLVTHQAGFTLVEILIAVALLGMIGAMVFGSLVMTMKAVEAGRDHAAKEQAIRRILRLMNDEISLSKRNTQYPWVGTNGTQDGQPADILAFLAMSQTLNTSTSKESESVRVVYTRERDRLIRFVRRNLYTLTDTQESVEQMELADRVQAFNIRYYDDQNRIWMDEWPSVQKMPKALLIEVTFQYPDAEPWTVREWVMIGTS
ncbi:MAG: type II secretion system protein GspJ [Nitrospira sp.]